MDSTTPSAPMPARPPRGMSTALRIKWPLFRALERLSDLRGNNTSSGFELDLPPQAEAAVWVFVSTIGELHAIDPWLQRLARSIGTHRLVLITDHAHYRDSYQSRYPQAVVCVSRGHGSDAATLARHYPPSLLVVAEIPCLPSDAPCRFSVAFLVEAKRRGAAALLVNGWLYGYAPACTMDAIERRWFERDYLNGFDMLCVQNETTAQRLLSAGAAADRLRVCGNIKFDAMTRSDWRPELARSATLLISLMAQSRPVVVAGCVTSEAEQTAVLEAFMSVLAAQPRALLVLAPRHPEVAERMHRLRQMLDHNGLDSRFRSALGPDTLPGNAQCLVLDTMGDLRDFYASASVAHVGVDHNVLEPLSFERPVTVMPGWEASYPSYPVYQALLEAGALRPAGSAAELAALWLEALDGGAEHARRAQESANAIAAAKGAVARHFAALQHWLETLKQ